MFWQALEQLRCWERDNLPGADTAVGNEVLVWLLKSKNQPRPLKDLYQSSRFSEPTIRNCLKQFSSLGFAIIESNGKDMRARYEVVLPEGRRQPSTSMLATPRDTPPGFWTTIS